MKNRGAGGGDPFAVDGMESPGAVECEAAGGTDATFIEINRIEGLNGVDANIDEAGKWGRGGHEKSLTETDGRKKVLGLMKINLDINYCCGKL
jgi:hypothetical protein